METIMNNLRDLTAKLIYLPMRWTGFRFSKCYRRGDTLFHKAVYACVNTVAANISADSNGC